KKATIEAASIPHPVYLRFTRNPVPIITQEDDYFKIGKANILREGSDLSIITCGNMVYEALVAADSLKKEKISARVINLHTPKPIDKDVIVKAARETKAILTCEEHTIYGGLGSAVCEVISESYPVPVKMMGIKGEFGQSGEPEELMKYYHLTSNDIKIAAKELISRK
ncbi:MAG TPA: transketolase family protein, partial [Candidatus Omnitrophica bacterium]|nr:transketolase family protein [Candidatus Omnitrophota bacterium]